MKEIEPDNSSEVTLNEIFEKDKEKETKKKLAEYARNYSRRPEIKDRRSSERLAKAVDNRLKKMDEDQHTVCKKLGKSIAHSRRNPEYRFKCTRCEVSYSEDDKVFFHKNSFCPCCHFKLRLRKTVTQKRNLT
jgi:RNA polymerase-binding transcription factor DksA